MPSPEYDIAGNALCPQVEPEASYWFECPILRTPTVAEVVRELGPKLVDYPAQGSNLETVELAELRQLYGRRDDLFSSGALSDFLTNPIYFRRPPAGAILRTGADRTILRPVDLATLFEAETPGLWHRHILNTILDPNNGLGACQALSPVRQALLWAALDLAIVTALALAWNVKWLERVGIGRRRRPVEADNNLEVLHDYVIDLSSRPGRIVRVVKKTRSNKGPFPRWPGTPRHPAYPSGHSTYSAAASAVLACFFPEMATDFRKLADDIGRARIWGGVHWPTDHTFGADVGRAVARLIIGQLNTSGIEVDFATVDLPPTRPALEAAAQTFGHACGTGREDFCTGVLPKAAPSVAPAGASAFSVIAHLEENSSRSLVFNTVQVVGKDD